MEYICPLCNGIRKLSIHCSRCGSPMEDIGRVQDYYDNYSPYLSYSITDRVDGEPHDVCQHIFICPSCSNDRVVNIKKEFF